MAECTLVDFDITIQGEQAPYPLLARYKRSHATGLLHATIADPAWRDMPRLLEQTTLTGDAATITQVGAQLFQALFSGALYELWVAARADLDAERVEGVRLRLDIAAADVAALPWEALYDPARGTVFAADSRVTLVRSATVYSRLAPARRLRVALPVNILIVAPDDPDQIIDSSREIAGTEQVAAALGAERVHVEVMRGKFNITELRQRLAAEKPAVLHFIGHGAPDGLWLWQRNQPILVSPDSWRSVLARARAVKLVILNACSAARAPDRDAFSSVGMKLLQAGVPAVIAMQAPIRDDAAINFTHSLYEELLCGACPGLIDQAVTAARSDLYALNPGDFSYGLPVLWLNSEDGRVFAFGEDATATPDTVESAKPIDLAAEAAWLAHISATVRVDELPAEYQFVAAKWRALLKELASLLQQLRGLTAREDAEAFANKVAEYRQTKAATLRLKRLIEETQGRSA